MPGIQFPAASATERFAAGISPGIQSIPQVVGQGLQNQRAEQAQAAAYEVAQQGEERKYAQDYLKTALETGLVPSDEARRMASEMQANGQIGKNVPLAPFEHLADYSIKSAEAKRLEAIRKANVERAKTVGGFAPGAAQAGYGDLAADLDIEAAKIMGVDVERGKHRPRTSFVYSTSTQAPDAAKVEASKSALEAKAITMARNKQDALNRSYAESIKLDFDENSRAAKQAEFDDGMSKLNSQLAADIELIRRGVPPAYLVDPRYSGWEWEQGGTPPPPPKWE